MITLEEACILQSKTQKKSIISFLSATFVLLTIAICLFFIDVRAFSFVVAISIIILFYLGRRTKIIELFQPLQYEGTVQHFNVRTEKVIKNFDMTVGVSAENYSAFLADMSIALDNGKIKYKTFVYTKEYEGIKAGDKVTVLRFVDAPVFEKQRL